MDPNQRIAYQLEGLTGLIFEYNEADGTFVSLDRARNVGDGRFAAHATDLAIADNMLQKLQDSGVLRADRPDDSVEYAIPAHSINTSELDATYAQHFQRATQQLHELTALDFKLDMENLQLVSTNAEFLRHGKNRDNGPDADPHKVELAEGVFAEMRNNRILDAYTKVLNEPAPQCLEFVVPTKEIRQEKLDNFHAKAFALSGATTHVEGRAEDHFDVFYQPSLQAIADKLNGLTGFTFRFDPKTNSMITTNMHAQHWEGGKLIEKDQFHERYGQFSRLQSEKVIGAFYAHDELKEVRLPVNEINKIALMEKPDLYQQSVLGIAKNISLQQER